MFAISRRAATILVVDDEPMVRRFVVATLESRQYTVIEASSGQEGLKSLSQHYNVDLVLTDILMPVMTGPEMIHMILKIDPSVRVMFMTGNVPDAQALESLDKNHPVLHKPFTIDALLNNVQECLAS